MTRSVEIPEAAVEAAYGALTGDIDKAKVRAVLEAALPYLAPAGDGGLPDCTCAEYSRDSRLIGPPHGDPLCPAHGKYPGGAPAVPQPVDREALEEALLQGMAGQVFLQHAEPQRTRFARQVASRQADAVLAVLAGEQEQVEK